MKCQYCQQECQPITPGPREDGLYENRIAQCVPCNVGYYHTFHAIYTVINNKEYHVIYMNDHPDHWTSVSQRDLKSTNIALQFHHHVKFTPQNFNQKLKLYLLFS